MAFEAVSSGPLSAGGKRTGGSRKTRVATRTVTNSHFTQDFHNVRSDIDHNGFIAEHDYTGYY
jgi:hypothetical protein